MGRPFDVDLIWVVISEHYAGGDAFNIHMAVGRQHRQLPDCLSEVQQVVVPASLHVEHTLARTEMQQVRLGFNIALVRAMTAFGDHLLSPQTPEKSAVRAHL